MVGVGVGGGGGPSSVPQLHVKAGGPRAVGRKGPTTYTHATLHHNRSLHVPFAKPLRERLRKPAGNSAARRALEKQACLALGVLQGTSSM